MTEVTPVLDHVATMTHSRDRELVDATLLSAFIDLLSSVQQVVLWRVQGEPGGHQEWLRSGHQLRGDLVPELANGTPTEPLPLQAMPLHAACFEQVSLQQRPEPAGQLVLLPMASGREIEGVLELRTDAPLSAGEVRLAEGVLKIHRNFLSLLDYSERDTLTGLLNRKSFDDTFLKATVMEAARLFGPDLATEEERRQSGQRRHWLGVADIDHFKLVNDRHGHLMGDEVLVMMARLMRSTFRYGDRLYRFGGEEFVVLLTAPDDDTARIALDRLRQNIEAFEFPGVGRVTASIGFSDVRPGDTPQAAFDRADRAVYHAKENGRNQVVSFADLVADGSQAEDPGVGEVELF